MWEMNKEKRRNQNSIWIGNEQKKKSFFPKSYTTKDNNVYLRFDDCVFFCGQEMKSKKWKKFVFFSLTFDFFWFHWFVSFVSIVDDDDDNDDNDDDGGGSMEWSNRMLSVCVCVLKNHHHHFFM